MAKAASKTAPGLPIPGIPPLDIGKEFKIDSKTKLPVARGHAQYDFSGMKPGDSILVETVRYNKVYNATRRWGASQTPPATFTSRVFHEGKGDERITNHRIWRVT